MLRSTTADALRSSLLCASNSRLASRAAKRESRAAGRRAAFDSPAGVELDTDADDALEASVPFASAEALPAAASAVPIPSATARAPTLPICAADIPDSVRLRWGSSCARRTVAFEQSRLKKIGGGCDHMLGPSVSERRGHAIVVRWVPLRYLSGEQLNAIRHGESNPTVLFDSPHLESRFVSNRNCRYVSSRNMIEVISQF